MGIYKGMINIPNSKIPAQIFNLEMEKWYL